MADWSVWPPAGAVAVDVSDAYERLAGRGYQYGPAFQGLRAMWRRGQEIFAEIALPEDGVAQVGGFGIHTALVDASFHAALLPAETDADATATQTIVPFLWQGVSLHATAPPGRGPHQQSR